MTAEQVWDRGEGIKFEIGSDDWNLTISLEQSGLAFTPAGGSLPTDTRAPPAGTWVIEG
jgi:hypothetical protein